MRIYQFLICTYVVLTLISLVLPTILYLLTSVKKEASYVQVVLAKESRVLY